MPDQPAACAVPAPETPRIYPVRPMGGNRNRTHWLDDKRQRTLSLTNTAWEVFGHLAEANESNRSEVLEILVRYAHAEGLNLSEIREKLLK